jgi:predicted RNase H-like nuclease
MRRPAFTGVVDGCLGWFPPAAGLGSVPQCAGGSEGYRSHLYPSPTQSTASYG